jgi:hypothetical protein
MRCGFPQLMQKMQRAIFILSRAQNYQILYLLLHLLLRALCISSLTHVCKLMQLFIPRVVADCTQDVTLLSARCPTKGFGKKFS